MDTLFITVGVIPAGSRKATYLSSTIKYVSFENALSQFAGMLTSDQLAKFVPVPAIEPVVVVDVINE